MHAGCYPSLHCGSLEPGCCVAPPVLATVPPGTGRPKTPAPSFDQPGGRRFMALPEHGRRGFEGGTVTRAMTRTRCGAAAAAGRPSRP
jgi:hypothetical protein